MRSLDCRVTSILPNRPPNLLSGLFVSLFDFAQQIEDPQLSADEPNLKNCTVCFSNLDKLNKLMIARFYAVVNFATAIAVSKFDAHYENSQK